MRTPGSGWNWKPSFNNYFPPTEGECRCRPDRLVRGPVGQRVGPDAGTEPYDRRVYTLELRERDPKVKEAILSGQL